MIEYAPKRILKAIKNAVMKLPRIALALCLSVVFASLTYAQASEPDLATRLTNKEIIELVTAGLSSEVIIAKIKVSRCNFDTDPSLAIREPAGKCCHRQPTEHA